MARKDHGKCLTQQNKDKDKSQTVVVCVIDKNNGDLVQDAKKGCKEPTDKKSLYSVSYRRMIYSSAISFSSEKFNEVRSSYIFENDHFSYSFSAPAIHFSRG